MKQVLCLKNKMVVPAVFLGLLFSASSFTFGPVEGAQLADDPPQKKVQRVMVTVSKNGKETKIDTTFNNANEKMVKIKVDSILKKLEIEGIEPGMKNIMIQRGGKNWTVTTNKASHMPGGEEFDILIQNGDSGQTKHIRKIIHMNDKGGVYSFSSSGDDEMLPPPPPIPPGHSMIRMKRLGGDPFALDPKDESIISYDKKDIGKGLEKITIVRKKRVENEKTEEISVKTEVINDSK